MNRIREFRRRQDLTLQALADAVGTSKSQVDKLEKGARRLTVDWMVRLAKPLGVDPRDLMVLDLPADAPGAKALAPAGRYGAPAPEPSGPQLLPVRGAARGGDKQEMFLTDGPIDHVPCPHYLTHVKDAYAMYVVGQSMAPMYRPRQMLFINPYKLPTPGNGVVIIDKQGAVQVKEFVKQKTNAITVREYQPQPREFTIMLADIDSVHAVVGSAEP